jgi:hypothetical protein
MNWKIWTIKVRVKVAIELKWTMRSSTVFDHFSFDTAFFIVCSGPTLARGSLVLTLHGNFFLLQILKLKRKMSENQQQTRLIACKSFERSCRKGESSQLYIINGTLIGFVLRLKSLSNFCWLYVHDSSSLTDFWLVSCGFTSFLK